MTPGPVSITLHVRSAIEAIGPATERAEAWLAEQRVSSDAAYLARLAIEELVTNCIKYGYDDSSDHTIDIVFAVGDGALRIEVIDDGHAFNPLEVPPPDLSLAMEDRPIGGLGIHLLRALADEITYERRDRTNRLMLMKRMTDPR
jgi:anti-sigma regulatory factor (Ser/Thr protein kinase)